MNGTLKQKLKAALLPIFAISPAQRFYWALHRACLLGMNIGGGSSVENSGEAHVLRTVARRLSAHRSPVVLDVGANMGHWTLAASQRLPSGTQFHCFEPSADTRRLLNENVAPIPNLTVHPVGVSDRAESLTLYRPNQSGCASLYRRESQTDVWQNSIVDEKISLVRLDEKCAELKLTAITFLKLDIEGHELAALRGCGDLVESGRIQYIQFEFGGCNIDSRTYFHDFWKLLTPRYRLYRILPGSLHPLDAYHETLEQFTTTNYLAIAR
jgi:FkbM family methyltransferase